MAAPAISVSPPAPSPLGIQVTPDPQPLQTAESKVIVNPNDETKVPQSSDPIEAPPLQSTMSAVKDLPLPALHDLPPETRAVLERIEEQFVLGPGKLKEIVSQFVHDIRVGLSKYGEAMAMIPTFVTGVPDGSETGTFLAVDLGGTNMRVCEVTLLGDHKFTIRQQKYIVSTELKTGEARTLFDYMADSVDHFLTERQIETEEPIHLGLTFSFPVEQSALDKGVLLTWTKGFSAKNAIGHDVVGLLQDAFDRKHLHVKCTALVNDTVGTLISRAYLSGDCLLGAIFGTGTNGAYVEDVSAITKLHSSVRTALGPDVTKMIINGEWGAFDNARHVLPVTMFDNKVDRESINPRFQLFEKFISGM
ncbi:glucokinase, partial [Tulasnella sp. 403]